MTRILVTGGTGDLGSQLVPRLMAAGFTVRVMSRRPRPAKVPANMEWAQADLETVTGLKEVVSGVEAVIHAATSSAKSSRQVRTHEVDVGGTRSLLETACAANVPHFIYVSIVGIEQIPFPYYREKVAAEAVVRGGGVPYTILRATQFHSLIPGMFLKPIQNLPFAFLPTDFKFQTIETGEVADQLTQIAAQPPAGLLPDTGGPQVLTLGEMAETWFAAQGKRCKLFRLPVPGAVGHSFRQGYNTCPNHRDGKFTWEQWLKTKYGK